MRRWTRTRLVTWILISGLAVIGCGRRPVGARSGEPNLEENPIQCLSLQKGVTNKYNLRELREKSHKIGVDLEQRARESTTRLLAQMTPIEVIREVCWEGTCGHRRISGMPLKECLTNTTTGSVAQLLDRMRKCENSKRQEEMITTDLLACISETNVLDWFYWCLPEDFRRRDDNGFLYGSTLATRILFWGLPKSREYTFGEYRGENMRWIGTEKQRSTMLSVIVSYANSNGYESWAAELVKRDLTNNLLPHVIDCGLLNWQHEQRWSSTKSLAEKQKWHSGRTEE